MTETINKSKIYIPGSKEDVIPFMRDVFTIPKNSRDKPRLIGSVCRECEEYFFPKTGAKATCDNPFCPRSTSEIYLSGKGQILSATVTRSAVGEEARVSAVILLEEGIKVNSVILGWEGFEDMLVPGTPVEIVLQEMEETEEGVTVVGYAFHLNTGRRKPKPQSIPLTAKFSEAEKNGKARNRGEARKLAAAKKKEEREKAAEKKKKEREQAAAKKKVIAEKKRVTAVKKKAAALAKKKKIMDAKKKAAAVKKKAIMAAKKETAAVKKKAAAKKKSAVRGKPKVRHASSHSAKKKKAAPKKAAVQGKKKAKKPSRKKSTKTSRGKRR